MPRELRRPIWPVAVFGVLLLAPPAIGLAILVAAVAGRIALGVARAVRARRTRERTATPPAAGVVLGSDDRGRTVVLSDDQLAAHALIVGASGAGKTTTLLKVLSSHIQRGVPVVAIDMKGSPTFAAELAAAAEAAGRQFRIWTPDGPSHWNPLAHGNPTELKDKLIRTERFTEPHYQRAAERYVQTALQVLQAAHPDRAPTLSEVVSLMDPHRMAGIVRRVPRPLAERVNEYLAMLTPDQLSAIRGLGTRLAIITESHTGAYLQPGPEAVDVRAALSGEQVALFSLNSSKYGQLSAQLGALAVQDLVTAVGARLTETGRAIQATIAIDEFSALRGDHVESLLTRGRESGASIILVTQELADLDRAGRGLRDQILGVTAVKIAHRQDVPSSAQQLAEIAGTKTVWDHVYQQSAGAMRFGGHDRGRISSREVERFVIHPNDIKSLPTGHAVVITKVPETRASKVRISPPRRGAGDRDGPAL